jgi:hypothetical protein
MKGNIMDESNSQTITGKMKTSPLDGVWVHVLYKQSAEPYLCNYKDVEHMGQVLGVFQDEHIAVQLLSFLDGRPTIVRLFPIEYATNGKMIFYCDSEEMDNSFVSLVSKEEKNG